jgi:hypothetical protein
MKLPAFRTSRGARGVLALVCANAVLLTACTSAESQRSPESNASGASVDAPAAPHAHAGHGAHGEHAHAQAQAQASAAPAAPSAASVAAQPVDAELVARLTADVVWLAADEREGRRSGEPGNEAAADWIAARCAELGLEPAGEGGSWFQTFEVPLPPRDGGASELTWTGGSSAPGQIAPLFCSEGGAAGGALALAGYGVDSAEMGWDDYAALVLEGRVALIARGAPVLAAEAEAAAASSERSLTGSGSGFASSTTIFAKVMAAKRRGAVAVLLAQHPSQRGEALLAFDAGQSARAGIPALMITCELADALTDGRYSSALAQSDAQPHAPQAGAAPRSAAQELESAPQVHLRADVRRERGTTRNVLALVRGGEGRAIVLGAHYDHLGRGGSGSLAPGALGEIHNGADDNASGTAVVLELVRRLRAGPPPAGDVLCALWSGEEEGLLGSEHWAKHPTYPLERVGANINFDMVGRAGAGKLSVLGGGSASGMAEIVRTAGEGSGLELSVSASGTGMGGSDHQTFLKRDIPALHLFSGVHTDYHKPSDDAERFEAAGAARVVELAAALVRGLQAAPELAFQAPPARSERGGTPSLTQNAGWRTWFGSVPDYAYDGRGVLLSGTSPGSPAERAGLLRGDVLLQIGDLAIDTIHDFTYALGVYKPGNVVLVKYERDGAPHEVRMTLATRALQ